MGSITFRGVALAAAMLAATLAPAWADPIIYNGGTPDHGGQIYGQSPDVVAMNFTLTAPNTNVTDANWWGGCFPSVTCGPSPSFTLYFYSDNSGTPGAVLASRTVGAANQTATGALIGPAGSQWDEYAYQAVFAPVALSPGTTYWFGITETVAEPAGLWGDETTSSAPAGERLNWSTDGGTTWIPLPEQLAFQLTGRGASAVPEPSSVALMASVLLILAARKAGLFSGAD